MNFEDIELVWKGETHTIPANKIMGAIARVEDVVTLGELQGYAVRRNAPIAKLSMAYGALLRYAGAKVTDEEIYLTVFQGGGQGAVLAAITNVMALMIPPSVRREIAAGDAQAGAAAASFGAPAGNA